jgi:hypothetical protein
LERAARLNERRDSEAQAAAWYTYAGVEALLEIIQIACPTAFPDVVAFLREQIEVHQPAGENPAPEVFAEFKAKKKSAAKRKAAGENSDDDRDEETSRKRRRLQRRVVDDKMKVDTDVPVRDRSSPRFSVPAVDFSNAGWPDEYRIGSSPLSEVEGVAGPSGLTTEEKEKEKLSTEMEIEDVAGPSGDPNAVSHHFVIALERHIRSRNGTFPIRRLTHCTHIKRIPTPHALQQIGQPETHTQERKRNGMRKYCWHTTAR